MIVADTGPLVAAANRRDTHHARCTQLLESHTDQVVVPAPVVVEVCQILASRCGTHAEAIFLTALGDQELRVEELVPADYRRAAELTAQYAALPLGAVDACVIATAERLGAVDVATLDRRHFRVVRPRHVDAFRLLPG
ncbi:MAG TPA: PIN domain-containing protein [Pseudonocardiaceae bacterium]